MSKERKTATQLVTTHPGVFERRREIILALCRGANLAAFSDGSLKRGEVGRMIVATASAIIEESEQ